MPLDIENEIAELQRMKTGEVRARYAALFGEEPRSRHKTYLIRKIIWRLQANTEGDLSERARQRAEELAIDAEVRTTEKPRGPRRRVLVVDDNRDAAEALAMTLRILGHEVSTAHDGETAVAAAAEYGPDLVLMDLGIPKVDGYEAARRIRALTSGSALFLVALTGWGSEDDRRRTKDGGFDRHLVKPVDQDALTRMIAEIPVKLT